MAAFTLGLGAGWAVFTPSGPGRGRQPHRLTVQGWAHSLGGEISSERDSSDCALCLASKGKAHWASLCWVGRGEAEAESKNVAGMTKLFGVK